MVDFAVVVDGNEWMWCLWLCDSESKVKLEVSAFEMMQKIMTWISIEKDRSHLNIVQSTAWWQTSVWRQFEYTLEEIEKYHLAQQWRNFVVVAWVAGLPWRQAVCKETDPNRTIMICSDWEENVLDFVKEIATQSDEEERIDENVSLSSLCLRCHVEPAGDDFGNFGRQMNWTTTFGNVYQSRRFPSTIVKEITSTDLRRWCRCLLLMSLSACQSSDLCLIIFVVPLRRWMIGKKSRI